MNAVVSRWKAVKRLKSNLFLVIAGCVLILLAVAWRLAIAPAINVEPTNFDEILYYDGTLARYVNPPGQAAVGADPVINAVRITKTMRSKPIESTPRTAVVDTTTSVTSPSGGEEYSSDKRSYSIDRETGEMTSQKPPQRDMSGYLLVFPFNTPKGTVPLWSNLTANDYPAKYQKAGVVSKLKVYKFAMSYGGRTVPEPPAGYPPEMNGAQLKQMLSMRELQLADSETVKPEYTASESVAIQAEPRMGNIVERSGEESVSLTIRKPDGEPLVTRLLYKLEYAQAKFSIKEAADFARDELSKLNLQYIYIPLGLLVLGLGTLTVGAFAGVKIDK